MPSGCCRRFKWCIMLGRVTAELEKITHLGGRSPSEQHRPEVMAGVQEMSVYEINDLDRGSPAFLRLSAKTDAAGKPVNHLGDLVPFTNKVGGDHRQLLVHRCP